MPKLPINEFIRLTESNSLVSNLTKRELFAAMAMKSLIIEGNGYNHDPNQINPMCSTAVDWADALIRELNK